MENAGLRGGYGLFSLLKCRLKILWNFIYICHRSIFITMFSCHNGESSVAYSLDLRSSFLVLSISILTLNQ
jgi:hypothetical protein